MGRATAGCGIGTDLGVTGVGFGAGVVLTAAFFGVAAFFGAVAFFGAAAFFGVARLGAAFLAVLFDFAVVFGRVAMA
jgi:hypothetical protein